MLNPSSDIVGEDILDPETKLNTPGDLDALAEEPEPSVLLEAALEEEEGVEIEEPDE